MDEKIFDLSSKIYNEVQRIKGEMQEMKEGQGRLETVVKEIDRKTSGSLLRIETEMNTIKKVTAKNCFDITHLKTIK